MNPEPKVLFVISYLQSAYGKRFEYLPQHGHAWQDMLGGYTPEQLREALHHVIRSHSHGAPGAAEIVQAIEGRQQSVNVTVERGNRMVTETQLVRVFPNGAREVVGEEERQAELRRINLERTRLESQKLTLDVATTGAASWAREYPGMWASLSDPFRAQVEQIESGFLLDPGSRVRALAKMAELREQIADLSRHRNRVEESASAPDLPRVQGDTRPDLRLVAGGGE